MLRAPPNKSGVMNEPMDGMNTRMQPPTMPGIVSGITTRVKTAQRDA